MPLTADERANLRPGIDADRLERFLDRIAPPRDMRAALVEAVSELGTPRKVLPEGRRRPAYLPAQADDFIFDDPELAAEWTAIAR
jgi:hypothetical protein